MKRPLSIQDRASVQDARPARPGIWSRTPGPLRAVLAFLTVGLLFAALSLIPTTRAHAAEPTRSVPCQQQRPIGRVAWTATGGQCSAPAPMTPDEVHVLSCVGTGALGSLRGGWWGAGVGFGGCLWSWATT